MEKKLLQVIGALALIVGIPALLIAATGDGRVDRYADGLRIDSVAGTKINLLAVGTVDVDNGSTSGATTITGAAVGDVAIVTLNEDIASAADYFATCTANTLTVTVNTDPGTTLTFNYAVFGVE